MRVKQVSPTLYEDGDHSDHANDNTQEGARLVLGDVSEQVHAVGEALNAIAVVADVSTEAGVVSLVKRAHEAYGRVDIFVSNAGILRGTGMAPLEGGPFSPDGDWDQSWKVNVMAHVWAARHVLPEMVEHNRQLGG